MIETPCTLTFSQNSGDTFQNGELRMVTPSTSTLVHSYGWINGTDYGCVLESSAGDWEPV